MLLNKFGLKKSFTVEVIPAASATQTTWQFQDIPFLRNKYINGISLSTNAGGITSGKVNMGYVVPLNSTYSGFLTLADKDGNNFIQNIPLTELATTSWQQNNNATSANNFRSCYNTNGITYFNPRLIVWTKCFIYWPTATALANYCCQFTVFYQDQK